MAKVNSSSNAYSAMQQAKLQGGNSFYLHSATYNNRDSDRWQLEMDLRSALTNKE